MKKANPFPYTHDNKRYHTYTYAMRMKYQSKVYKVGLDAGFSCPNRDGTCAHGGCIFCSSSGSGDQILNHPDLNLQINAAIEQLSEKWPSAKQIAYFQSYTNTYASLRDLQNLYTPFFMDSRFVALDIATRPDCLEPEKLAYFKAMMVHKDLMLEIGLQSIHSKTALWMNRGHDLEVFDDAVSRCKQAGIPICIHIINGFPDETRQEMLETVDYVAALEPDMVKLHMLHILEESRLGHIYQNNPFPLLTQKEYVELIVDQLELLPPTTIIARLTGDGPKNDTIAPKWTLNKKAVLNEIDQLMAKRDTFQGRRFIRKQTIIK